MWEKTLALEPKPTLRHLTYTPRSAPFPSNSFLPPTPSPSMRVLTHSTEALYCPPPPHPHPYPHPQPTQRNEGNEPHTSPTAVPEGGAGSEATAAGGHGTHRAQARQMMGAGSLNDAGTHVPDYSGTKVSGITPDASAWNTPQQRSLSLCVYGCLCAFRYTYIHTCSLTNTHAHAHT